MAFTTTFSTAAFEGTLHKLTHESPTTGTSMNVNLFIPAAAASGPVPALIFLSGLTCSPDNCTEKGFLHAAAAAHGIAIVYPDTSPRGLSAAVIPDLDADWAFGDGASFYVDATKEPYARNFQMETYIVDELPRLLWSKQEGQFRDQIDGSRVSICGHSMGGHGALSLYLRHPGAFRSVSAWAPVANPVNCPWGQRAFAGYFGERDEDRKEWKKHDATELVAHWQGPLNCLIDTVSYLEHINPETALLTVL